MKRPLKITALFLDIGDVPLTNGWAHPARKRATTHFTLEWAKMEDRPQLNRHLQRQTHTGRISETVVFNRLQPDEESP
jgi:hypothetical protein